MDFGRMKLCKRQAHIQWGVRLGLRAPCNSSKVFRTSCRSIVLPKKRYRRKESNAYVEITPWCYLQLDAFVVCYPNSCTRRDQLWSQCSQRSKRGLVRVG